MQVTHENSNITHVAMGGLDAIECGITGDAHFMHMLSASLYKDQQLAMVREVACNAWDAHLLIGKTDPIEITLNNEELIIKDFGPGIPHDKIGPIYGVYGASTKKDDGKQTGGFGLGCKSPWSYTDTFEVISCHEGKKAVYQMTKSSAEKAGKPSIKPIVANLPTTETGITVKIRMKSWADSGEIMKKLCNVLYYGGIPCILNGKLVETIEYEKMVSNWVVVNHRESNLNRPLLMVRYGNVTYPITEHAAYQKQMRVISQFMKSLPTCNTGYAMIFQAPPDSLAPTPSREELSMIDMTVDTLSKLLQVFVDELNQDGQTLVEERALARIRAAGEANVNDLLEFSEVVPKRKGYELISSQSYYDAKLARPITELSDLADLTIDDTYPGRHIAGFRKKDLTTRFEVVKNKLKSQWNDRLLKSYEKAFASSYGEQSKMQRQWATRNVLGWFVKKMLKHAPNMKMSELYVLGQGSHNSYRYRYAELSNVLVEFNQFIPAGFYHMLPFLFNRVILTHSRTTIVDRMWSHKDYRHTPGRAFGSIVVVLPRSPKRVQEARDFLSTIDASVIDMTSIHEWEADAFKPKARPAKDPNAPKAPKRVKKKGFLCLAAAVNENGAYQPYGFARDNPEAIRIEVPKFQVTLRGKFRDGYDHTLGDFRLHDSRLIARLYGQYGAICQKQTEIEAAEKLGAGNIEPWVLDRVFKEMKTNKRIRHHLMYSIGKVRKLTANELGVGGMLYFLLDDPVLCEHYKMQNQLSKRDELLLALYESISEAVADPWGRFRHQPGNQKRAQEWKKLAEVLAVIPPAPHLVSLAQKLVGNVQVELLNTSNAGNLLRSKDTSDEKKDYIRSFIINAIG